jgi:hypothetical protein
MPLERPILKNLVSLKVETSGWFFLRALARGKDSSLTPCKALNPTPPQHMHSEIETGLVTELRR